MVSGKGLDFKHKEVINITDGKRLRLCRRCNSRFRNRCNYLYYCTIKDTAYQAFIFNREIVKNSCVTNKNYYRKGHIVKHKFEYEVVCKVEI